MRYRVIKTVYRPATGFSPSFHIQGSILFGWVGLDEWGNKISGYGYKSYNSEAEALKAIEYFKEKKTKSIVYEDPL